MLDLVIPKSGRNALFQCGNRNFFIHLEYNCSIILKLKRIAKHFFKGGDQFAGTFEVHSILVRVFVFPVYPNRATVFC